MKELKDISWLVDEATYRADPAYSYSIIAKFNREGFDKLDKLYEHVESPSLTFGSAVDTLLTGNENEFNERFAVVEMPEISDSLVQIAKTLYGMYGSSYNTISEFPKEILSEVGEECGFWKGAKYNDRRANEIIKGCSEYYLILKSVGEKTVLSTKEYEDALACADALKTSENTSDFFTENPFDTDKKNYYQLKFKGEYEGIPLRCMMDVVRVDYKNKIITPIDLKTSYNFEWHFHHSFVKWFYNIQASLYFEILRQNVERDPYFKDFKIENYKFVVISNQSRKPLVWEYLDTKIDYDVRYGKNNQYLCRNWRNIVKELDSYIKEPVQIPHGFYNSKDSTNDLIYWLNEE